MRKEKTAFRSDRPQGEQQRLLREFAAAGVRHFGLHAHRKDEAMITPQSQVKRSKRSIEKVGTHSGGALPGISSYLHSPMKY
jgi:hypothetical protein